MKPSIFFYIAITTVILLMATILGAINFSFSWVFYTICVGQLSLLIMVYKILIDKYTTTKKFKDFYEDAPIRVDEISQEKFRN